MLISVHLPKTAGSSFLAAIEQHFGERLLKDYTDRPITRTTLARNTAALKSCLANVVSGEVLSGYDCIHGHFMPLKYRLAAARADVQFVTWMRHPVDRLASHYFHWMRAAPPAHGSALRRRVYKQEWTLERFCLGPEFRNLYAKYLWGFPQRRFDFIGITEHYEEEMAWFSSDFMHLSLPVKRENINPQHPGRAYIEDASLRSEIERYHAADMALYEQALQLRKDRLSTR